MRSFTEYRILREKANETTVKSPSELVATLDLEKFKSWTPPEAEKIK